MQSKTKSKAKLVSFRAWLNGTPSKLWDWVLALTAELAIGYVMLYLLECKLSGRL